MKNEKMNRGKEAMKTELVFILDKSGSMAGLESDTVGGFNSMISKQKRLPGECYVSTVLFSNTSKVLHDRRPLPYIKPLATHDYEVGGMTALIDAIGGAIKHIGNVHKYARAEDRPDKTLFVIMTDGMENASRKYSSDEVKSMIRRQQEKYGWEFLFIGANIDAVETAHHYGIAPNRAANYHADSKGTRKAYAEFNNILEMFRMDGRIEEDWNKNLREDFNGRNSSR